MGKESTPVFLPGESRGQGAWWATVHRAAKSQTQLKRLRERTHACAHTHTHTKLKKVKIMCSGDFFFFQFFFSLLALVWNDLAGTDCQR